MCGFSRGIFVCGIKIKITAGEFKMIKLHIEKEEYAHRKWRLSLKLLKEMQEICDKKNISMNKLVDICLRFSIDHLDQGGGNERTLQ